MKFLDLSGYMFSGKAAVSDLISEFSGFSTPNYRSEFDLIRIPNGLADLKHALVDEWSWIRADAALRNFIKVTEVLGRSPSGLWEKLFYPGFGYSTKYQGFTKKTDKFVNRLTNGVWPIQWPYELPSLTPLAYAKLRVLSRMRGTHAWPEIAFHLCSGDEFIEQAKYYVEDLLVGDLKDGAVHTIVTHNMLEPFNPAASFCFFDSIKSIVVDRDIRDIYMTAITYSYGFNDIVPLYSRIVGAFDIDLFIQRQRILRSKTDYSIKNNILRIRFEDLVLDYDQACQSIYTFLELSGEEHKFKMKSFNPRDSKKNIGLWKNAPQNIMRDIIKIQQELPDLCYQ